MKAYTVAVSGERVTCFCATRASQDYDWLGKFKLSKKSVRQVLLENFILFFALGSLTFNINVHFQDCKYESDLCIIERCYMNISMCKKSLIIETCSEITQILTKTEGKKSNVVTCSNEMPSRLKLHRRCIINSFLPFQ